jgi:hypothetical protein
MKDIVPTSIRINELIYNRIKAEAAKEKRSISAQIEYNLEKYYEIMDTLVKPSPHQKSEKDVG